MNVLATPGPLELPALKRALRGKIRSWRQALDPAWVAEASAAVCRHVLECGLLDGISLAASYLAVGGEVQTGPLHEACSARGIRLCVPAHDGARGVYTWTWYEPGEPLRSGPWGVPEPARLRPAPGNDAGTVLVPVVAVDRQGRRLGHGGGWYDRLLEGHPATKAALAFLEQVDACIPAAPHDVRMDCIVTEAGPLWIEAEEKRKRNTAAANGGPEDH